MDIKVPLRDLGAVDAAALRDVILAQEEIAWREDRSRQESRVFLARPRPAAAGVLARMQRSS